MTANATHTKHMHKRTHTDAGIHTNARTHGHTQKDLHVPKTLNLVKKVADLRLTSGNIRINNQNGQVFCRSHIWSKVDGGTDNLER